MSCVARPYSESVKRAPIHPSTTSERSAHRAIIPKAARYNANTFLRHIIRHLVRQLSRYRVSRLFIFLIFFLLSLFKFNKRPNKALINSRICLSLFMVNYVFDS